MNATSGRGSLIGDATGAVADLGVMVPLAAALIGVNGLDAGAVFLCAGLLVLLAGAYFGIPFPVQPLKALTAVAVVHQLSPEVIHAAGLEIAAFLLLLSIGGVADRIARIFTRPVVRALQFAVGVLLVATAVKLGTSPPDIFRGAPPSPWPILLMAAAFFAVWWAARTRRYGTALVLLAVGVGVAWTIASPRLGPPSLALPSISFPHVPDFGAAFLLLVVPQVPLTFGNAVVGVTDVASTSFGEAARRVTPARVCLSCGIGNVVSGVVGGMPMCHGAGGLTAHVRLGARTRRMNVLLGSAFVILGLLFAAHIPAILGLLPVWALGAFLAYAGIRHAALVTDLRGMPLLVAVVAGGVGAYTGNLAITVALGLAFESAGRLRRRVRGQPATAGAGRRPL